MRYYAPYIAALIVIIFIASALFHHGSRFTGRSVKYGNPAKEKLLQEYVQLKNSEDALKFRLYMGSDGSGGACWYSVTAKQGKGKEMQVFASFSTPVVDKITACDTHLRVICGKNIIKIPLNELDQRSMVPLVYYMGNEMEGDTLSADKI